MTDDREAGIAAREDRLGVGSLTPDGNAIGPKAWDLIVALSQYDDYLGAVLEVVDEAAHKVRDAIPAEPLDVERLADAMAASYTGGAPLKRDYFVTAARTVARAYDARSRDAAKQEAYDRRMGRILAALPDTTLPENDHD